MAELKIGERARKAKLRTWALRDYESIAQVPASRRVGRQRRDDQSVLQRFAVI